MFTLKIQTENAAFHEQEAGAEVARILRRLAHEIQHQDTDGGKLFDANGNSVGTFKLTAD